MENQIIVSKAKEHLLAAASKVDLPFDLVRHVKQVERWAHKLLVLKPDANADVVLLSVWLHDIGQVLGDPDLDHEIKSEEEVLAWLPSIGVDSEIVEQVAHCARAHRNKDVKPKTLEANLLIVADSASHMTDVAYVDMMDRFTRDEVMGKLERDWRDVQLFPEILPEIKPIYEAWRNLLTVFPEKA